MHIMLVNYILSGAGKSFFIDSSDTYYYLNYYISYEYYSDHSENSGCCISNSLKYCKKNAEVCCRFMKILKKRNTCPSIKTSTTYNAEYKPHYAQYALTNPIYKNWGRLRRSLTGSIITFIQSETTCWNKYTKI